MIEPSVLTSYLRHLYANFTSDPSTLTEEYGCRVRQSLEFFKDKTVFVTPSNDDSTFPISQ